jgi:hypothetical protein
MAKPRKPARPDPKIGEQTAAQDPFRAVSSGQFGGMFGPFVGTPPVYATTAGVIGGSLGAWGGGWGYANNLWSGGIAPAALLGTDAYEGRNRYSGPGQAGTLMPGVLPGYAKPAPGTYTTYRIMAAHPTLVLAGAVVIATVLSTEWAYEETKKAPANAKDEIQGAIEKLRVQLLLDCLRALPMGWSGFERIYEVRGGLMLPKRLKYLIPELTGVQVDDRGNFAGLKQGDVELPAENAFIFSSDREGDNYYGRSRMENCRRAWSNWLMDDDNLGRLGSKASSILPIVKYPPGSGQDAEGKPLTNYANAVLIGQGMQSGRPVVMANLAGMELEELKMVPEMAKASLWDIDTIDMGNPGSAQEALLKVLQYRDALLVRGWCFPERGILEAQRGGLGQGDSKQHGDFGVAMCGQLLSNIVRDVNRNIIDDVLVYNWGEEARGTVYAQAAPQDDDKLEFFRQLLIAIASNPAALPQIMANLKGDAFYDTLSLPKVKESFTFEPIPVPPVGGTPPKEKPVDEDADKTQEMSREGHRFASTQINLPDPAATAIRNFADTIPDEDLAEEGREDEPHVTVKYGLHYNSPRRVAAAVDGFGPVSLKLGKLKVFSATEKRPSDVLVADVESPGLHRLNTVVSASGPHTDTHPTYQPHATIAYLKAGRGAKYAGGDHLAGHAAVADSLVHSDRDGEVTDIPLGGSLQWWFHDPEVQELSNDNHDEKGRFTFAPGAGPLFGDPPEMTQGRLFDPKTLERESQARQLEAAQRSRAEREQLKVDRARQVNPDVSPNDPFAAFDAAVNAAVDPSPAPPPPAVPERESDRLPAEVTTQVKRAADYLRDKAGELEAARQLDVQSDKGGHYEHLARVRLMPTIEEAQGRLDRFRVRAAARGIDGAAVIAEQGGIPADGAFAESTAAKTYRLEGEQPATGRYGKGIYGTEMEGLTEGQARARHHLKGMGIDVNTNRGTPPTYTVSGRFINNDPAIRAIATRQLESGGFLFKGDEPSERILAAQSVPVWDRMFNKTSPGSGKAIQTSKQLDFDGKEVGSLTGAQRTMFDTAKPAEPAAPMRNADDPRHTTPFAFAVSDDERSRVVRMSGRTPEQLKGLPVPTIDKIVLAAKQAAKDAPASLGDGVVTSIAAKAVQQAAIKGSADAGIEEAVRQWPRTSSFDLSPSDSYRADASRFAASFKRAWDQSKSQPSAGRNPAEDPDPGDPRATGRLEPTPKPAARTPAVALADKGLYVEKSGNGFLLKSGREPVASVAQQYAYIGGRRTAGGVYFPFNPTKHVAKVLGWRPPTQEMSFDPGQPRIPPGTSEGGEFAPAAGSDAFAGDPLRAAARGFADRVNARLAAEAAEAKAKISEFTQQANTEFGRLTNSRADLHAAVEQAVNHFAGSEEDHDEAESAARDAIPSHLREETAEHYPDLQDYLNDGGDAADPESIRNATRFADATSAAQHAAESTGIDIDPDSVAEELESHGKLTGKEWAFDDFREDQKSLVPDVDPDIEASPPEHRDYLESHRERIATAIEEKGKIDPEKVFAKDDEGKPAIPYAHAKQYIEAVNADYQRAVDAHADAAQAAAARANHLYADAPDRDGEDEERETAANAAVKQAILEAPAEQRKNLTEQHAEGFADQLTNYGDDRIDTSDRSEFLPADEVHDRIVNQVLKSNLKGFRGGSARRLRDESDILADELRDYGRIAHDHLHQLGDGNFELAFNPNQQRAPKGSPGGGRWLPNPSTSLALTGREFGAKATPEQVRNSASEFAKRHLRGRSFLNDDTGKMISVSGKTVGKIINNTTDVRRARLLVAVPQMIKHAKLIRSIPVEDPTKTNVTAYHRLQTQVNYAGKPEDVKLLVREQTDGHWYYNHDFGVVI